MLFEPAEIFKVLSVETRVKIIELLKTKGPLGAKDISETLGLTAPAVSQQNSLAGPVPSGGSTQPPGIPELLARQAAYPEPTTGVGLHPIARPIAPRSLLASVSLH